MKKTIVFLMMALMVMPVMAKKNWQFKNDKGECVYLRDVSTNMNGKDALHAVRSTLYSMNLSEMKVLSEKSGKSITFKIKKKIASGSNRFTGRFTEYWEYKMVATYAKGKVSFRLSGFINEYKHEGTYTGSNSEITNFNNKLREYEKAEKDLESTDKAAKKQAKATIKAVDALFNGYQREVDKLFMELESTLR